MSKNFLITAYKKLQRRLRYGLTDTEADALNDAFCQLWAGGYEPATDEEGEKLLYTTLRRRRISLWRDGKQHPQAPLAEVRMAEPLPDYDAEETYRRVWELVMSRLTPLGREILVRHDVEGETYGEIAERLGMQEAAVRMQLSRARKKIREEYRK